MIDPREADHAEFGRMVPEKIAALASASAALAQASLRVASDHAHHSADDAVAAARAALSVAACRSPSAILAVQSRLATHWVTQVYAQSMAFWATGLRFHEAALAPFHRAATRNARRLRK